MTMLAIIASPMFSVISQLSNKLATTSTRKRLVWALLILTIKSQDRQWITNFSIILLCPSLQILILIQDTQGDSISQSADMDSHLR